MKKITGLLIFGILLGAGSCIQKKSIGEPLEDFSSNSFGSQISVCNKSSIIEQKPQMVRAVLVISK